MASATRYAAWPSEGQRAELIGPGCGSIFDRGELALLDRVHGLDAGDQGTSAAKSCMAAASGRKLLPLLSMRLVRHRADAHQYTVVFISQHIQQSIRTLTHIANALMQLLQQ